MCDYFLGNVIDDGMAHVNIVDRMDALTSKTECIPFALTYHTTNKTVAEITL